MSIHTPVMLQEVLEFLDPEPGRVIVDGTMGGGGHSRALAERVSPHGRVLALDRDPAAVEAASQWIASLPIEAIHGDYRDLSEILVERGESPVDAILVDLGLSSDQLADANRGFSFSSEGPLDLRFDPTQGEPAHRLVNRLRCDHLADLIYEYGEERYSRRIARAIVEQRRRRPIETAEELASLVRQCVPGPRHGRGSRIDSATRTFQALRIAVNDELGALDALLRRAGDCLKPGGRLAVISFHSLEDRRVKLAFRENDQYEVLTKKPVRPTEDEVSANPRARSARLRVCRKS